ncbi:TonB-dependent receptor [Kaistella palustris]|uniref:TonB-dependent receptor n=1 Tax=Kaistella palustris TaxID=493376 RepID=UPI0004054486|nr:TonB-dependent receptor [Kaistella palustris]
MKQIFTFLVLMSGVAQLFSQTGNLAGTVRLKNQSLASVSVTIPKTPFSAVTDSAGNFKIENIPTGSYHAFVSAEGYRKMTIPFTVTDEQTTTLDFGLTSELHSIEQVVITGTRTPKRKTSSPVIVNLINSKTLDQVVATTLSEGLKYQPGLRVETDCQTCNYTQLRINGLQGGYSQILINSRPIFSPLMGLYGMEQIPANMIDRIEVVRGGVSALYGSSAIGGTVNVITKIPDGNNYSFTNTLHSIKGSTADNVITGNASFVNKERNLGVSVFFNNRQRRQYDANGDNFSELPELKDNTFGANMFIKPGKNQKLELSLSSISEYRFGGEMVKKPAYLARQSEERTHEILLASADYTIGFNDGKNSLSLFYGGQKTDRKHYTGIHPDDPEELSAFFADPPYGTSDVITHQGGLQFNHRFNRFLVGNSTLTMGAEYVYDKVFDEISAYNYEIDQTTKNIGAYVQNDWDVTPELNFLTGFRLDKHNLLDHAILSPRLSLLYKGVTNTQFRLGWGTGFRAPQAFDTDLHIAFAGGGVSRILLSPQLKEERSNSFTGSVNYDKATEHFIAGFTVEGFYTKLKDVFFQFPLGKDEFGSIFEKRNGDHALVKGITLEARANFDYVVQLEGGFTFQKSRFNTAVSVVDGLEAKREFLRTPNNYGYATVTYNPNKNWNISVNGVFTGRMLLAHVAGEGTGQDTDAYFRTRPFTDLGLRAGHTFKFTNLKSGLELFGGLKNIFDSYQKNFDTGKNRDSDFIYGPSLPRTLFLGIKLKSL